MKEECVNSRTSAYLVQWTVGQEEGRAADVAGACELSVQFSGDFDGATLSLEGSNDGKEWAVLSDKGGLSVSTRRRAIFSVGQSVRFVRPQAENPGKNTRVLCTFLYKANR